MAVVGIIPVRSFAFGKQRLAGVMEDTRRQVLGERLAVHVASVSAEAGLLPLIVTAEPKVAEWAIRNGFPAVDDPSTGLDDAASVGIEWAMVSESKWVVLHSDLPLLHINDVKLLHDCLEGGRTPIAPSVDGGTSALGGKGPFETSYGPASFHRHLKRMEEPLVVATSGLLHDIDSPDALRSASRHPRGRWLGEFL